MARILILLLFLSCLPLLAAAEHPEAEPELISVRIVELIDTGKPVILDIQAGDLTSELGYRIRRMLLDKGADLRETEAGALDDIALQEAQASEIPDRPLGEANLVRISMELGGLTIEEKGFLTYNSQRFPLYTFQIRQISLPAYSLKQIDSLSFVEKNINAKSQPLTTIKWFEPVLASTALASIIYLLWTTE